MAVYGPATGHYSSQSIRTARKTGGSGGSRLTKTSTGWNYTPDSSGYEDRLNYGGSNSGNSYYDQYQSLLEQQRKAQEDAIAKRTQATVDSINAYRPKVEQSYADQQKANYIANAKNQSQMGDYLGAMGYSGGMAESTMADLNNTYLNNRAAADTQKNNAMLSLDQQVAQARSTGDASLADSANSYYTNYLSALQNQQQFDYQKQLQEQEMYANTIGADSNDYMAKINQLKAAGVPEDDYRIRLLYAARNEKVAKMEKEQKEAQKANEIVLTPYLAWQMYNKGVRTQEVLNALNLY